MTKDFNVSVSMNQAAPVKTGVVLKQGDFGFDLIITVLDFTVTGTTPQIVFRKPMGAVESTDVTASGNVYTYTFKGTELDTPGKVFCDLKLKNSTTQRISTASFQFECIADTLDGLTEESSSYSDTIAQIVDGFDETIENLEGNIDDLKGIINDIILDTSSIVYADGYYNASGNLVSGTAGGFKYSTNYIKLHKGYTIRFKAKGYLTNVCMIGQAQAGTTAVIPLVISQDSNLRIYEYTATEDTNIRFCYLDGTLDELMVFASTETIEYLIGLRPLTLLGYFYSSATTGIYNDLNNLPAGTIATYAYSGATNAPYTSFTGIVATLAGRNEGDGGANFAPQLAIDRSGGVYVRGRYTDYTAWIKLVNFSDLENINSILNIKETTLDFSNNKADGYFSKKGKLNTGTSGGAFYTPTAIQIKRGDILKIHAQGYLSNMALVVSKPSNDGIPLVMSQNNISEYLYLAKSDISVRFCCLRSYEDNFSVSILESSTLISLDSFPSNQDISTFRKYGVVGDSLSSGECVHNESGDPVYTDFYEFSWVQYIARKTGNAAINFSKGGLTTRSWLTNEQYGLNKLLNPENKCDCYFMALGENDANVLGIDYLGDISDVNVSDPTQSADTFYGNYAKIIGYIKQVQPKAIIFCITRPNPNSDSLIESFNEAIRAVSSTFETCTIELTGEDFAETYDNRRWGHYNAWGYNQWSDIIIAHVNDYMKTYPSKFRQIEFIGTNYSWN